MRAAVLLAVVVVALVGLAVGDMTKYAFAPFSPFI